MDNIIMICAEGDSSKYVYNNAVKEFNISKVFVVGEESKSVFLKKRIKRHGLLKVIGQIAFIVFAKFFLQKKAKLRIEEINHQYKLNSSEIPEDKIIRVESVNSKKMKQLLKKFDPDLVIINGTTIIKNDVLDTIAAPFLNIHAGITPKYRGVHGGYWALYNDDARAAGVTTHFVDAGIDTGTVLDQRIIQVDKRDNFLSYPHLQLAEALSSHNSIIRSILDKNVVMKEPLTDVSRIWTHPTLLQYFYGRIFKNIK